MKEEEKPKPDLKRIFRILEIAVVVIGIISTIILLQNPPKITSKAASTVIFTLNPDTSLVNSNSELKLDVNLNPFGNPISVLDLVLEYDPSVLSFSEGGVVVGTMLPVKLGQTKIENIDSTHSNLTITLIAQCDSIGCLPALAPDKLASIKFKVLTPNGNTQVSVSPITKVLSAANTSVNSDSLQYTSNISQIIINTSTSSVTNLKPVADTYIKERYPTKNYSNETNIIASNYERGNAQSAYLKFDLTKISGLINKAQLKLIPSLNRTVSKNFMTVANSSWTEEGLTWRTQPEASTQAGSYAGQAQTETPIFIELDRSAIQAYAGKLLTIKIDNIETGNNTLQVYSREVPQKEPELILDISGSASDAALQAIGDTYVQSLSERQKNNYGESAVLIASNYESNNTKTAYIKFDASRVLGKTIKKATLQLTANLSRDVQKQIRIVSDTSWNENVLSYSNKPTMGEIVGVINLGKNDLKVDAPISIPLNTSKIELAPNGVIAFGIDNTSSLSSTFSVYSEEVQNESFKPKLIIETY